ncbi:hypothetical protein BD626DRAFT_475563 [Schizophyllum amplum]|uniref:Uncharacterized protein n=1 Tax=Schizophyllum amplum TaxID=97359 RepID=A0A550CYK4_9AGAR|nr:hypothetical protein BD626DRAFT_475563 [Auriculariopsis ampla]
MAGSRAPNSVLIFICLSRRSIRHCIACRHVANAPGFLLWSRVCSSRGWRAAVYSRSPRHRRRGSPRRQRATRLVGLHTSWCAPSAHGPPRAEFPGFFHTRVSMHEFIMSTSLQSFLIVLITFLCALHQSIFLSARTRVPNGAAQVVYHRTAHLHDASGFPDVRDGSALAHGHQRCLSAIDSANRSIWHLLSAQLSACTNAS